MHSSSLVSRLFNYCWRSSCCNQPKDSGVVEEQEDLGRTDSPEDLALPDLPPVDRGTQAWTFVAVAFALKTLVWGFGFT